MKNSPTGIEMIAAAVHEVDAARSKITQLNEALRAAQDDLRVAEQALVSLVASGACSGENACTHAVTAVPDPLADKSVRIIWRIALMLLANPVLDYQMTALRLWGPSDRVTAKNRVNAHMQQLRKLGIVKTLGSNRFWVDVEKLAEKSGVAIERTRNCADEDPPKPL